MMKLDNYFYKTRVKLSMLTLHLSVIKTIEVLTTFKQHLDRITALKCKWLSGVALGGDWGRVNVCKGLIVALCFIPLW